jgi:hypothetical protein
MKKKLHSRTQKTVIILMMVFGIFTILNAQTKITSPDLIGSTTNWWNNDALNLSIAFDGIIDDGSNSNFLDEGDTWGFVGFDFGVGNEKVVAKWSYAPRTGWASRLNGSELRGSNSSDFLNDYVVLHTVTADPTENVLTDATITDTNAYRYVYWFGGVGTWANISESHLYDSGDSLLNDGTAIGRSGASSWCADCTYDKALDNDFGTYVENEWTLGTVGYDFGAGNEQIIHSIKYAPRAGWAARLNGSELRGSNSPNYFNDFTVIYTIPSEPTEGVLTEATINGTNAYRYIYWRGDGANISELEMYSASLSTDDFEASTFKIYPNPSNGDAFNISLSSFESSVNVKVYSILGKIVLNKDFIPSSKTIEVKQNLTPGLYIVKVNDETTSKLVVK